MAREIWTRGETEEPTESDFFTSCLTLLLTVSFTSALGAAGEEAGGGEEEEEGSSDFFFSLIFSLMALTHSFETCSLSE